MAPSAARARSPGRQRGGENANGSYTEDGVVFATVGTTRFDQLVESLDSEVSVCPPPHEI